MILEYYQEEFLRFKLVERSMEVAFIKLQKLDKLDKKFTLTLKTFLKLVVKLKKCSKVI